MEVACGPDLLGVLTESTQIIASGFLEAPGYIRHVAEWGELLDIQSFTFFALFHEPQELVKVPFSLWGVKRPDLAGIDAPYHVLQVPLPA